jgi:hypothetical protein
VPLVTLAQDLSSSQVESLILDKEDLLKTKKRNELEISDLQKKQVEQINYINQLKRQYEEMAKHASELRIIANPTRVEFNKTSYKVSDIQNPITRYKNDILKFKTESTSLKKFYQATKSIIDSYRQFGDYRDQIIGTMLVSHAAFKQFGNDINNTDLSGCVSSQVKNGLFTMLPEVLWKDVANSDIACCTDYLMLTANLLKIQGYDDLTPIYNPPESHQILMVSHNKNKILLDPTFNYFIDNYTSPSNQEAYIFTNSSDFNGYFQTRFYLNAIIFGVAGFDEKSLIKDSMYGREQRYRYKIERF